MSKQHSLNIKLLLITTFVVSLAMSMNGALYNNFLKVLLGGNFIRMGQVEAVRETPGILSAFMNSLGGNLPEPILAALCLLVMGLGYCGYFWTSSVGSLMAMSFLWSIGFHLWAPLSGSIGMSLAPEGRKGELLGKIASIGAVGTVLGYLLIAHLAWLMQEHMQAFYRWMYFVAGIVVLLGMLVVWKIKMERHIDDKPRLIFKKQYGLFYILQFLEGCRKQVFITFATFTLVLSYKTGPELMAILLFLNYIVAFIVAPIFGRWIDRYGEKNVLTINYIILILVFLGYAIIHQRTALFFLFCADNVLFTFSIALTTYVGKIAPREDVTGTLAMGVSVNHVAAVIVPLIGFSIWQNYGYEPCFVGGAIVVALQLVAVQWLRTPGKIIIPEIQIA